MRKNYSIRGREIYSAAGKLVAALDDDGNPVMALGMAGAHSKSVREFLGLAPADPAVPDAAVQNAVAKENSITGKAEVPPEIPPLPVDRESVKTEDQNMAPDIGKNVTMYVGGNIPAAKQDRKPETVSEKQTIEEWEISTIPEDQLPPFSMEHGVNTPGFAEYVNKHNLSPLQKAALVKRLENR